MPPCPPRTSKIHFKAVPDLLCSALTPKPSSAQQFHLTAALLCLLCFFSPPFPVSTSNIAVPGRSRARCVVPAHQDAIRKGIYSRVIRGYKGTLRLQEDYKTLPAASKGNFGCSSQHHASCQCFWKHLNGKGEVDNSMKQQKNEFPSSSLPSRAQSTQKPSEDGEELQELLPK